MQIWQSLVLVPHWPGSTHDSRIFQNSTICSNFGSGLVDGFLFGDAGYPYLSILLTPLQNPNHLQKQDTTNLISKPDVPLK